MTKIQIELPEPTAEAARRRHRSAQWLSAQWLKEGHRNALPVKAGPWASPSSLTRLASLRRAGGGRSRAAQPSRQRAGCQADS